MLRVHTFGASLLLLLLLLLFGMYITANTCVLCFCLGHVLLDSRQTGSRGRGLPHSSEGIHRKFTRDNSVAISNCDTHFPSPHTHTHRRQLSSTTPPFRDLLYRRFKLSSNQFWINCPRIFSLVSEPRFLMFCESDIYLQCLNCSTIGFYGTVLLLIFFCNSSFILQSF